jgi:hypothetical protein
MIRTEIYVEGNQLDVTADLDAVLTFSIDDIKDFSQRTTKYSKTIVIPGTNQNNFVFGNLFDVSVYNSYDANLDNVGYNYNAAKAASCEVYVDRVQVFKGVIRILEITVVNGVVEYETAIFGDLGGFIAALGDSLLETLDFSSYNHTFNESNIQNSWAATPGASYYYPLIDYGYTTDGTNYDIVNFRPALHVKEYIDKIMSGAGYTYTSSFFDSAQFKKLIIPANVDVAYTEVNTLFSRVLTSALTTITPPHKITYTSSIGTQYATDVSGTITYSRTGNINVLVSGTAGIYVENGATDITARLGIYKNGTLIGDEFSTTIPGGINAARSLTVSTFVALAPSDYLELKIAADSGYTLFQLGDATFKAEGQPVCKFALAYGDTLNMQGFIPKGVKRVDFFKNIVEMFNLYITEDATKDKHLNITPYKDFYDTSLSNAIDWTYMVDHIKPIKVKPMGELNAKAYEFKYKDDTDYYNESYKNKYSTGYGTRLYDTGLEFVNDTAQVELIFAASVLVQYSGTNRVVPAIYKSTNNVKAQYNSVIRILYRKTSNTACSAWNLKNGGTTLVSPTDYPYAGHIDDPLDPTLDLLWGAPNELYYDADAYPVANLFNVYWDDYIFEITSKDSKLVTAFVKLTPVDILQLDFSKYIFIGGQLFRLNKITDYNALMPDTTKCELLNVIDI